MSRIHRFAGFTMVDLLITVVILGILAAIVVPKFSDAGETSRSTRVMYELRTVRSQLELYRADHAGKYPTLAQMWSALTGRTNAAGQPVETGGLGPYLKKAPTNPYTDSQSIVASGAGGATDGWTYDEATGAITAVGFDEAARTFTAPGSP